MNLTQFSLTVVLAGSGLALAAPVCASVAVPANTVAIAGLFDTGVDDSGNALVGGNGVIDPHYQVFSSNIGGVVTGVARGMDGGVPRSDG